MNADVRERPGSGTNVAPAVEAIAVSKHYGPVAALKPTSFSIRPGSYYVLLGPSGGGKTTTLRLIGGLIRPSSGRILIDGADVTDLPPNRRNTSMVFQNYALFPHMSVEKNVGYGLSLRRMSAGEITERVDAMLSMVGLTGYNRRMPHQLSGGQQQRVQLARSLVLESSILLLDEPLAALDEKLRKSMCIELKRIQDRVGITFVHVTHNQEEAMTVADEIAVMAEGEMIESGRVRAIYETPERRFTADFIGESAIFEAKVLSVRDEFIDVDAGYASIQVPRRGADVTTNDTVWISLRSELAHVADAETPTPQGHQSLPVTFVDEVYLGFVVNSLVALPDGRDAYARAPSNRVAHGLHKGDAAKLLWQVEHARLHTA